MHPPPHGRPVCILSIAMLFASLFAPLGIPGTAGAWSSDPTLDHVIVDQAGPQQAAAVVADGSGGAFVAWQDSRLGSGIYQVYVQHIAADGSMSWADDGILAGYGGENQIDPVAATDGAGGVIVAWEDARGDGTSIYAQRLDAAGNQLWGAEGRLICDEIRDQGPPSIASDGAGGAFLAWNDRRRFQQEDIFGQRVGSDGSVLWAAGGFGIQVGSGAERYVRLVPDGAGGAIAVTADLSNDVIRALRLTADAATVWGPVPISDGPQNFPEIHAAPDGTGGAIVVWRSTFNDLVGQRVDGTGAVVWNGGSDHEISPVPGSKTHHRISSDGVGGVYVAWSDWRNGIAEVFAQHVDAAGARLWTDSGAWLDDSDSNLPLPSVTGDGAGNAVAMWLAQEGGAHQVQAQKLSPGGAVQWATDGVDVSIATTGTNAFVEIVPASDGGAIAVIERYSGSSTGYDLYAKKVNADGGLSTVVAVIDPPAPSRSMIAAYPNPFRARVHLVLGAELGPGDRIDIVDVAGRHVRSLSGTAGSSPVWDGTNLAGRPVAAGIYFARLARRQDATLRIVRLP